MQVQAKVRDHPALWLHDEAGLGALCSGVCTRWRRSGSSIHSRVKIVRSMRPSSASAAASSLWRLVAARVETEWAAVTWPDLIDASSRMTWGHAARICPRRIVLATSGVSVGTAGELSNR